MRWRGAGQAVRARRHRVAVPTTPPLTWWWTEFWSLSVVVDRDRDDACVTRDDRDAVDELPILDQRFDGALGLARIGRRAGTGLTDLDHAVKDQRRLGVEPVTAHRVAADSDGIRSGDRGEIGGVG